MLLQLVIVFLWVEVQKNYNFNIVHKSKVQNKYFFDKQPHKNRARQEKYTLSADKLRKHVSHLYSIDPMSLHHHLTCQVSSKTCAVNIKRKKKSSYKQKKQSYLLSKGRNITYFLEKLLEIWLFIFYLSFTFNSV